MTTNSAPHILTPGPVAVPKFIFEAIQQPVIHQRSPAFIDFFQELQLQLQYLFQTENPVLAFPATGSMAFEMTLQSLLPPQSTVAIAAHGKFSDRWLDFAQHAGYKTIPLRQPWGEAPELGGGLEMLIEIPDLAAVVLTHCETSTGALTDLEEIAFFLKKHRPDLLIIVDAMSTIGVLPYYHDAWQIDASVCSSQKGLFNPSGTAFVALSANAISRLPIPPVDDAYHLGHYWKYLAQGSFPFTPPTQLFYGINRALKEIQHQGLPARWNLSHQMSQRFKKGIEELGGKLVGQSHADSVTAFALGNGNHDEFRAELYRRGYELAGGQGPLKSKIMRVGHFGWVEKEIVEGLLEEIEAMKKEGKWT